jgi:peptide deformylase
MVRKITTYPDPILQKVSRKIEINELQKNEIKTLIADLIETMYQSDGVGIAAPQIGESVKICVIAKKFADGFDNDLTLINPVWQKKTILKESGEEGCLSVPNVYGKVKRYKKISVEAMNEQGKIINFNASKFFARIIQHEIDHLNGVLFIEKASGIYNASQL